MNSKVYCAKYFQTRGDCPSVLTLISVLVINVYLKFLKKDNKISKEKSNNSNILSKKVRGVLRAMKPFFFFLQYYYIEALSKVTWSQPQVSRYTLVDTVFTNLLTPGCL